MNTTLMKSIKNSILLNQKTKIKYKNQLFTQVPS